MARCKDAGQTKLIDPYEKAGDTPRVANKAMSKTRRSKIKDSKRMRLVEPRKDAPTIVTFLPKTGRRRKSADDEARKRDSNP